MRRKIEWYDISPFEKAMVLWEGSVYYVPMRGIDIAYQKAQGDSYSDIQKIKPIEEWIR